MKSAEEKQRYKSHFFKLGQGRIIAADRTDFWDTLWKDPQNSDDIFELLTPFDIKTIRDQNRANFLTFIYVLCEKIVEFSNQEGFPSSQLQIIQLLTCTRFLTKIIPFLYELPEYEKEIETEIFWNVEFNALKFINGVKDSSYITPANKDEIIAVKISRALVKLLFIRGFTLDRDQTIDLWEPGIGGASKYNSPNLIIDSNRTDILKLILTFCSYSLYQSTAHIVSSGSKFLTLFVTCVPRIELLTLVCSLTNLVCRSSRSSSDENVLVFVNNSQLTEMRHLCVTYSVELLTMMTVYPLPSSDNTKFLVANSLISSSKPYNTVRLYLGKLHKEKELIFLGSCLTNIVKHPLYVIKEPDFNLIKSTSTNPPSLWATETIMLIWELIQCNKNFKSSLGQRFIPEIMISCVFNVISYHNIPSHKDLVRISSYFMLYISSDPELIQKIFEPIDLKFYESLPVNFRTNPIPITTRDFIVTHICNFLTNLNLSNNGGHNDISNLLLTTHVEILYNLIEQVSPNEELPHPNDNEKKLYNPNPRGGLSYSSCSAITSLITKLSTKPFLSEKKTHPELLAFLIRAVCTAIIKYPKPSRMLLFSILKNEKVYDQVWTTVYGFSNDYYNGNTLNIIDDKEEEIVDFTDSEPELSRTPSFTNVANVGNVDDAELEDVSSALRSRPPTGMSERAKEKLPMESPLSRTWGGNDALRIILTIIIPHLKVVLKEIWSSREGSSIDSFVLVKHIEETNFDDLINSHKGQINFDFLPDTPLEALKFNWSHISLGWYMSLLYSTVYNSIDSVRIYTGNNSKIMKNISSSIASVSKITSYFMRQDTSEQNTEVNEWVSNALTPINQWSQTSVTLFKIENSNNEGIFGRLSGTHAVPGTPGGVNDMANHLVRRLSDFRINNSSRTSISSGLSTPIEEQEAMFSRTSRNSVTSLHSLNTLNRSRSNTPRNSISM
ncbi:protein putatively [Scheffersomyces coipomensis]|uniref:protein putatively n=1 Tax=Scheffersomyces coipomensis TaxID=1788519 RepID=UPI00315D2B91